MLARKWLRVLERGGYFSESFGLGVFLEREGGEVGTGAEDTGFGEDGDSADTVNVHFDVRVTVGVAKVGEMWAPGCVLGVAFDDDGVLVEGVSEGERSFGFLP